MDSREERNQRIKTVLDGIKGLRKGLCPCGYMGTLSPAGYCFKCGTEWGIAPEARSAPEAKPEGSPSTSSPPMVLVEAALKGLRDIQQEVCEIRCGEAANAGRHCGWCRGITYEIDRLSSLPVPSQASTGRECWVLWRNGGRPCAALPVIPDAPPALQYGYKWVRMVEAAAPIQGETHPDDLAVDRFAEAMKAKLAEKRAQGRGGWDDPAQCTVEFLAKLLVDHLPKGDPVDVANFAMMLHQRGAGREVLAQAALLGEPLPLGAVAMVEQILIDEYANGPRFECGNVAEKIVRALAPAPQARPLPLEADLKDKDVEPSRGREGREDAPSERRVLFCVNCDTKYPYTRGNEAESAKALSLAAAHDAVCPGNPLVARIQSLTLAASAAQGAIRAKDEVALFSALQILDNVLEAGSSPPGERSEPVQSPVSSELPGAGEGSREGSKA